MSAGHDDFHVDPIRGLPERPPADEPILWQGAPRWRHLARDVFHLRAVAVYLALLIAWRATAHGSDFRAAAIVILSLLPIALLVLALLGLVAWLAERTTVYTITSRRIVMKVGIALPVAFNIPFSQIAAAGLACKSDGGGNISLKLTEPGKVAYAHLWPHVRPWHLTAPEPMLRAIPDAAAVADLLGQAVREAMVANQIERQVPRQAAE